MPRFFLMAAFFGAMAGSLLAMASGVVTADPPNGIAVTGAEKLMALLERFSAVSREIAADKVGLRPNATRIEARAVVEELHRNNLVGVLDSYLLAVSDNDPIVQGDWHQLHTKPRTICDLFRCAVYICNTWPDRNPGEGRWTRAAIMRSHASAHFLQLLAIDSKRHGASFDGLDEGPKKWISDVLKLRSDYSEYELLVIGRIQGELLGHHKAD